MNYSRKSVSRFKQSVSGIGGSWAQSWVAIALLLSSAGLVSGGMWLSIQLFINPDAALWVNQILPWAHIPVVNSESAQTLAQIRASVEQQGQILGEPLSLDNANVQPSLLLPLLDRRPNCYSDCEQIVELQLYQFTKAQQDKTYYQLIDRVSVEGPDEGFVSAPLAAAGVTNYGSDRPLPLTELHRFTGNTPTTGIWMYLSGERSQGVSAIAYGQILYYNPKTSDLSVLLPWTSTQGQIPQWQQVTGGGWRELAIDQTVDLEPQFSVYQVNNTNNIQLDEISLQKPALNSSAYQNAILLAQNGLYSPAWKWLQFQRQQHKSWSTAAQAQMDLIELYAQFTQKQAEQTWASPSQQILADLIDGRWGSALQVFESATDNIPEVATMLEADRGQLWDRVTAALQVNPNRPEVQAWGALIVAAKSGNDSAIAWLKQQPQTTTSTLSYINKLLSRLEGNFLTPETLANTESDLDSTP